MIRRMRARQDSPRDRDDDMMRLRDVIMALKGQHGSASELIQRIDPAVADGLRAYAAHRHVDLMDLAADCLEHFVADAADAIWQLAIERRGNTDSDPEAALLGDILETAIRARLQHGQQIVSKTTIHMSVKGFGRSGHPYTMA